MNRRERDRRFNLLSHEVGCVPCRLDGRGYEPPDVHHQQCGLGKREGDHATLPMCPWHHRGIVKNDMTAHAMAMLFGPSRALEGKAFVERYGDDTYLLVIANNMLKDVQDSIT